MLSPFLTSLFPILLCRPCILQEKIVDLMKDAELQDKHTQAKDAEGEQGDGVHLVRLHSGVVDGGLDGSG
jgi:hypothetical protein